MRINKRRYKARWLLPLLFVVGYIATFSIFEDFAFEYFSLTTFSVFACCLLLSRLNRPLQITLPFWTIFAVFMVAYYFKFYWLAIFPEIGSNVHPLFVSLFFSIDGLILSYATTTYAFGAFCIVSWLLLGKSPAKRPQAMDSKGTFGQIAFTVNYRFVSSVVLMIVLFLMAVTTFLMYATGIAVMGAEAVYLPFRLAGFVYYTRIVLIPALLLLLIWFGLQTDQHRWTNSGLILLLLHGLSDMVFRSSRGGLAVLLLPLGFLFLASGLRVRRSHIFFLVGSLLLIILLHPIVSEYRFLRIDDPGNIALALSSAVEIVRGDFLTFWDVLSRSGQSILLRLSGVELLIVYTGLGIQPLGSYAWAELTGTGGLARYVTMDIFGFPCHAAHSTAPGMVGWFYLVGGNTLVVLGLVGFTLVTHLLWKILSRTKLRSLPVAQALFLAFLFILSIDGVLEGIMSLTMLVYPVSIAVCEWLMRLKGKSYYSLIKHVDAITDSEASSRK